MKMEMEMEEIRFGHHVLYGDVPKVLVQRFQEIRKSTKMDKFKAMFIGSQIVSVSDQDRRQLIKWTQIFLGKQFLASRLSQNPKRNQVLIKISHINFKNLKTLCFFMCNLESIQPINWIDCPNLTLLNLQDNFMASLKPLKKVKLPHLTTIYINLCVCVYNDSQLYYFNQLKMYPQFKVLCIESWYSASQKYRKNFQILTNCHFLAKLQASNLTTYLCRIKFVLSQQNGQKYLKEKFLQLIDIATMQRQNFKFQQRFLILTLTILRNYLFLNVV